MQTINKPLVISTVLGALTIFNSPANALDKPKTMEDMWKIIQAQQKQIDEMSAKLAAPASKPADVAASPGVGNVAASSVQSTEGSKVKTLERKTDILSQEVEKLRTNLAIPEEAKYKSAYGLGPAASKVYAAGKGLSIGGYGEGSYQAKVGDKGDSNDTVDLARIVLYTGYKFTDNILFNSELEYEHATTGEGSEEKGEVSVEFASLDFFWDSHVNARAGLMLMPMGFINRIHEPLFYFGNQRPLVERRIIPSTWGEFGAGLFGAITPNLTYTAYVVNGLDAKNFSSDGIREGRGGGSNSLAENFGYVAHLEYVPEVLPGMSVGGSAYVGNSGQNQQFAGQQANVFTQLYEGHLQWKYKGLELRGLGSWGHINNADLVSASVGEVVGSQNYGWYTEAGYDILPLLLPETSQYLAPFFRYEKLDTVAKAPLGYDDDKSKDWQIIQFGLQYKPIPNVVIKTDYRNFSAKEGKLADDFNLGFGLIF